MKTIHVIALYLLGVIISGSLIFACIQLIKTNETLAKTHETIENVVPESAVHNIEASLGNIEQILQTDLSGIRLDIREGSNEIEQTLQTNLSDIEKTMKYFEEYSKLIKKYLMPPIMTVEPIQSK